jgi:CBS domain-containing protein
VAERRHAVRPRAAARVLRERRPRHRAARQALVSVAGLIGRPVVDSAGQEVGRLVDVVVRWGIATYPPVTGLVAQIGRRRAYVPEASVAELRRDGARLASTRLDLRDFVRRPGEVSLMHDVVDHQLVDVNDRRVVRPADLYLAEVSGRRRLVAVDVSVGSLLRRLGPARWRTTPTPARVIDWGDIQPLDKDGRLKLREPNRQLHRLRPDEVADLVADLGRAQRQQLLEALGTGLAADVVEELSAEEVEALLRDAGPQRSAELLAAMEPDEAVDALRDFDDEEREEVLAAMAPQPAAQLRRLLRYQEDTAGGIMTISLVVCRAADTVADARARLREAAGHGTDIDGVVVADGAARVVDDVSLLELLLAEPDQPLADLVGEPFPVTVTVDAPLSEVVERLVDVRRNSLLVVDDEGRPVGRILADDVVDALTERGRQILTRLPT